MPRADLENKNESSSEQNAANLKAKYLSRGEVFADEIAAQLSGSFKEKYLRVIDRETRKNLNEGLRSIERWANLGGELKNPVFRENNLDHVTGLLKWCREIEDRFPLLKDEVTDGSEEHWHDLLAMLIMHDIGEIATGDLCRSHPDFNQKAGRRHKRKEALSAHLMLSKINPENTAKHLQGLYRRFDLRHPEDKLVNLGHVLDKCQADATAAREIIPYNADRPWVYNSPDKCYDRECNGIGYAEKVAGRMVNIGARKDLAQLLLEKVVADYDKIKTPTIGAIQQIVRDRIRQNIIR